MINIDLYQHIRVKRADYIKTQNNTHLYIKTLTFNMNPVLKGADNSGSTFKTESYWNYAAIFASVAT